MRRRKPRAYLKKYITGYFGFEYSYHWVAKDCWDNSIASCKTRKECEAECRRRGYVPISDSD